MVTIVHSLAEDFARGTDVYELALQSLLPDATRSLLLRACLADGEAAAHAWHEFAARIDSAQSFFEMDESGLKGLLPLLAASLARNGLRADPQLQSYVQQAAELAERQAREYGEVLDSVLQAFEDDTLSPLLLKAGALAATVYPQPGQRQNHSIDLLVEPHRLAESVARLTRLGWTPRPTMTSAVTGEGAHRDLYHSSGLVMGLHSTAFFLPHFHLSATDLNTRARVTRIGRRPVWIAGPEDMLVHVCGHATYSRSRFNMKWICDVFHLLRQHRALDWRLVLEIAVAAGVALPLAVQLRWLREELGAPVPAGCIAELEIRSRPLQAVAREGIFACLLHATLCRPRCLSALSGDGAAWLGFLRFSAIPSVRYVRWRHNVSRSWQIPGWYLDRPRRGALRLLRKSVRHLQRATANIG